MKLESLQEARRLVQERGYRVVEHVSNARGHRVNVVDQSGRPLTLRVPYETEQEEHDGIHD